MIVIIQSRIIQKILKDGIDIDKLLVVTFTNAAASEMRERVLEAIYKKLDEEPENENLQKQIVLLGKSNICTIHSFCLDVIKNNFYEIDLSANFRIATEEEIEHILYLATTSNAELILQPKTPIDDDINLLEIYNKFYNTYQDTRLIPQVHKFLGVI